MRVYINAETNQYPLYEDDIKQLFGNTSFAVPFNPPAPFKEVQPSPRPTQDANMNCIEGAPQSINGVWTQTWEQVPASADQITARTNRFWDAVRNKRDQLLRSSDWTVSISDSPLSADQTAAWVTYRQALRDVTTQDMSALTWPTPPSA